MIPLRNIEKSMGDNIKMYLREVQCDGVYNILLDMISVQGQPFEKTLFSHSLRVGNTNSNK